MAVAGELYNHASEVDKAIYKFYITRSEVGLALYNLRFSFFKLVETVPCGILWVRIECC